uniref:Uncharacterized protein n=1 Tax=Tanacetum cinerariifolium TaxID=118510 RepID=A0A699IXQ4_TANCI|nr:hypothetical protein [Tanacetum cinerariifolium]
MLDATWTEKALQRILFDTKRERKTYDSQNSFKRNVGISSDSFKGNVGNYSSSFASVLKSDSDFNLSLMGKVKDITAFQISIASQKFIKHAGVGSWFSSLQPASNSFVASKWVELVEWKNIKDNNFFRKQHGVKTKLNEIICERFKVIIQENVHWVRAKEMEGCDPLIRNESYASSSSDEENEQENEGSRNRKKYESDKKVDKVFESSCMQGDTLFYDNDNNKSKERNV